ncbi:MAG: hypothetical protein JXP34_26375 [Planctomycetes bacterium]|nr:hypothetical protein [Planctomycetota bacterium]
MACVVRVPTRPGVLLVGLSTILGCEACPIECPNGSVSCEAKRCFAEIMAIETPPFIEGVEEDADVYDFFEEWGDLIIAVNEVFWKYAESPESMVGVVGYLVEQFGRHGPEVDLKLFLCGPQVIGPTIQFRPAAEFEKIAGMCPRLKKMKGLQILACEKEVPLFVENEAVLDRFYDAAMWSRYYFPKTTGIAGEIGTRIGHLGKHLLPGSETYWWYARDFVLLVHATGRDDLLVDAKPDDLRPQFEKWRSWMVDVYDGGFHIEFDADEPRWVVRRAHEGEGDTEFPPLRRPGAPFPEWTGRIIPPPQPPLDGGERVLKEVFHCQFSRSEGDRD